ncbi:GTP cyclohydrolase IIa [Acidianus ambivalens]|uniref:GTP cyclohydrolase III n=1 Tax=Acidianus ambivalens TaxID=2283 RepID=A0A650CXI4_ACIAM|nr:GTP cyclohydrolase IIa [Acidianus ambivalens]MQL54720.1 GTP cyclohydrolase IIa [Acidianus ambivalens]QGR22516.1 GTP cyclohydrolase IIa [Acidianus ambivalens]
MKILLMEFIGYKEWTESLGYDREWKIQDIQSSIYKVVNDEISRVGGFALPVRYDGLIILADGIPNKHLLEIYTKVKEISPTKINACIGYGKTPREAEINAHNCILNSLSDEPKFSIIHDENVVACHFDYNNFTSLTHELSFYAAYMRVMRLYSKLSESIYDFGGISQYLGGDNMIAFIDEDTLDKIIKIVENMDEIKVGIGIGKNARSAMAGATRALDEIRSKREDKWKIVKFST